MYNLALPREFPQIDRDIRDLVESTAKEGPITLPSIERPAGFPSISLIMIVKNEWHTLRACVERVLPVVDEIIIERAPVLRGTYSEAMADAANLVAVVNEQAESADDEGDDSATVGRVDDSYCFVLIDGALAYSEAEAA